MFLNALSENLSIFAHPGPAKMVRERRPGGGGGARGGGRGGGRGWRKLANGMWGSLRLDTASYM